MANERASSSATDQGASANIEHNAYAGAKKTVSVGPSMSYPSGLSQTAGIAFNTAASVFRGETLWIFNNSATVKFFTLYQNGVSPTAPSGITSGIPVSPNSWLPINAGFNDLIVAQDATLGLYRIQDDTRLIVK